MEGDQVDPQHAGAIDTTIAGTARDLDLGESRFPKDALTKTLEGIGRNITNNSE